MITISIPETTPAEAREHGKADAARVLDAITKDLDLSPDARRAYLEGLRDELIWLVASLFAAELRETEARIAEMAVEAKARRKP